MAGEARFFSKDQLRSILWGEEGEVVLNEVSGQGRWETYYRLVFKPEGEDLYFQTEYSKGSTEQQDTRPWEYDDEVECTRVVPYPRFVTDYKPYIKEETE